MKTKIFIITGFLGAGKTTLLKRILESSVDLSKTVVLINEFGKIGIDKSLIKSTAPADIVELTSGCICCSLKTDPIQTLQILRYQYAPERLVIEATGVADPLSIIEALRDRMLLPHFQLEKTITVVDSDFWEAREAGFISFSFKTTQPMDKELFMEFLDTIPLELFRIKGPVRFADRTQMLNFVGGKSEWQKWSDAVTTCLAFIGWDVIEELILKKLNQCIVTA